MLFHFLNWQQFSIKSSLTKIPEPYNLRLRLINFLRVKDLQAANFIELIVFNSKNPKINSFYKQLINLGLIHLISVSGFHLSLLSSIIYKILKKRLRLAKITSFFVCLFYGFLLGYGFAILRVLVASFLNFFKFTKSSNQPLLKTVLSGLIILLINPFAVNNLGFQLSFLGTIVLCSMLYANHWSKIILAIITSLLINFLSAPIILKLNQKIHLLIIFNSWIFTPIISFYYIASLLLYPFWFLWPYLDWFYLSLQSSVDLLAQLNWYFELKNNLPITIYFLYYLLFFIILLVWIHYYQLKAIDFLKHDHHSFSRSRVNQFTITQNSW
ncbi:ComEC/Rec2 family competence protein [Mycoplasma amphoriforme]